MWTRRSRPRGPARAAAWAAEPAPGPSACPWNRVLDVPVLEGTMSRFLGFSSFGLAALALAVALFGSSGEAPAPEAPSKPARAASSSQDVQALERRVRTLEESLVQLSSRLMALERRPATAGGDPASPSPALAQEVEALKEEMRSLMAGEALHSEGGREYLKDAMRSVQEEMRTAQRQERQQQWAQVQAQVQAERSERLRRFISDARLSYSQEQALTSRLNAEDSQRQALMSELQAGSKSQRDIRREIRTLRTQTDGEMRKVLSEDQWAKYEELRRDDGGPRRQNWRRDNNTTP